MKLLAILFVMILSVSAVIAAPDDKTPAQKTDSILVRIAAALENIASRMATTTNTTVNVTVPTNVTVNVPPSSCTSALPMRGSQYLSNAGTSSEPHEFLVPLPNGQCVVSYSGYTGTPSSIAASDGSTTAQSKNCSYQQLCTHSLTISDQLPFAKVTVTSIAHPLFFSYACT
jgi:hypothetical protein